MRQRYSVSSSFNDLLFNALLGFFILLLLSLALIKPETEKDSVQLKAEYLISIEWPNKSRSDVDVLLQVPNGEILYYGNKDIGIASLDRDDQGAINDEIVLEDGTKIKVEENWENVAIRQKYPGEFILNLLMFSKRDKSETPVTVKIEQLNPYRMLYSGITKLTFNRQEETVLRFILDANGKIVHRSTEPEHLSIHIKEMDR